jgi:hypothetical protein
VTRLSAYPICTDSIEIDQAIDGPRFLVER